MSEKTYRGSCHCGAIRFEAEIDLDAGSNRCNCSICTKARAWFVLVKPDKLRVLQGEDAHADYQWVPPGQEQSHLHYQFCKTCGVRTFGWGDSPQMGKFYFVSVPALDVSDEELARIPVRRVDGRNGRFDRAPVHDTWM
jgi:hypothetical protein